MSPNGRPTKLDALYRGPYRVAAVNKDRYTLNNLVTGKFETDKSVHSLKLFKYDATRTNPRDIALKDSTDMYLVERIVQHKGSVQRKSELQFLVKWLGYNDSFNTWEPFSSVRDNAIFHEYCKKHKMEKLIPEKFLIT